MTKHDLESIKRNENLLRSTLESLSATIKGTSVLCPFHSNTNTAAGSIRRNDQGHFKYHCFGCSPPFEGSVIDVLVQAKRISVAEAIEVLAGNSAPSNGYTAPNYEGHTPEAPAPAPRPGKYPPLPPHLGKPFLPVSSSKPSGEGEKRLFASFDDIASLISSDKIGGCISDVYTYTESSGEDSDDFQFKIIKWNKPGESKQFWQCHRKKDGWVLGFPEGKRCLYGLPRVFKAHTVLCVEGEKCVEIANSYLPEGYAATTWAGGKNAKMDQVCWEPLSGKRLFLWPDFDELKDGKRGGFEAMNRVVDYVNRLESKPTIGFVDVETMELPEGGDIEQWIESRAECSKSEIATMLINEMDGARVLNGVSVIRSHMGEIFSGRFKTLPFPFNWSCLTDTKATLPESIHIICGSPGSGKSWFMMETFYEWAAMGHPVSLFMAEKEQKFWLYRALAYFDRNSNLADDDWNRSHRAETDAAIARHADKLNTLNDILRVSMSSETMNQEYMLNWIRDEIRRGVRVIGIDPVTKLKRDMTKFKSVSDADDHFMEASADLVRNHNVTLFYVSHPAKQKHNGEPKMDDLAGGTAYSRFSDSGMWIRGVPKATIDVRKNGMLRPCMCNRKILNFKTRSGKGGTNTVAMYFDPATLEFAEQGIIEEKEK